MAERTLTVERLRELLHYDPLTGVFIRRVATGRHGCKMAGKVAGSKSKHSGYVEHRLCGAMYLEHWLAWAYVHGSWSAKELDHINGVRDDNRITNLREVTRSENNQNRHRLARNNTSGATGVDWQKSFHKWRARITVNYDVKQIGRFDTFEEAKAARIAAAIKLHPFSPLSFNSTQPGPPDDHDPAESRSPGPPIRPEPEETDDDKWFPSRDSPGFLENAKGQLKTDIPTPTEG